MIKIKANKFKQWKEKISEEIEKLNKGLILYDVHLETEN